MSNDHRRLAALGDKKSIFAFKALGIDIYPASKKEAQGILEKISKEYEVILISEDLLDVLKEVVKRYDSLPAPAITFIPLRGKSQGKSEERIREIVKKAVGTSGFF